VNGPSPVRGAVAAGVVLASTLASIALMWVFDGLLSSAGRPDLTPFNLESLPYVVTCLSSSTVGAVLAIRRPGHPVGWLFLALGGALAFSGLVDAYAAYGVLARPGSLPAAELAAAVGAISFIPWFVLIAWILQLTPTGTALSDRWRRLAIATTVAGALWMLTGLLWPDTGEPPFDQVRTPLALPAGWLPVMRVVRLAFGVATAAGLVLAGGSLLVRFRRSRGTERRQLLWLAIAVVPLPAFVVLAFYASPDQPLLLALATGGFIGLIPFAAGLSVARYHLYDVERILSRALAYLLVSGVLALTFGAVVVAAGQAIGGRLGDSSIPAVLGTLVAVAVATPAYRGFQEAIDRRFNRRRYDALRRVRAFVRDPSPDTTIEAVLREALGDPTLHAAYWVAERDQWVSGDGSPVTPEPDDLPVTRQGRAVARVRYDAGALDRELVVATVAEATGELENAGLRAKLSGQLAEVRDSRARIATAHLTERRRIERNLHDGAQQRLLALALQLRAAQVNGAPDRLGEAVGAGIEELQTAVVELRELANGLHPTVLREAGLGPAIEDLVARFPVSVVLRAVDRRFPPEIEATAWFIACEAVANAVKHAAAARIEVDVSAENGRLVVRVADDGVGGADPTGSGLRGIADRAEAAGGSLTVRDGDGTTVIGELPCGS
jgi:signal transduction histidine kinase